MSASVRVRISCDTPGCPERFEMYGAEASTANARRVSVGRGWDFNVSTSREFDLCPTHAKEATDAR